MGSNRAVSCERQKAKGGLSFLDELSVVYPQWDIHKGNETVYLRDIPCVAEMGVRK